MCAFFLHIKVYSSKDSGAEKREEEDEDGEGVSWSGVSSGAIGSLVISVHGGRGPPGRGDSRSQPLQPHGAGELSSGVMSASASASA